MEAQKNKKDSIFTGIFPSHEPLPPQEAVPHSYKPAVSEEQLEALNTKMESMERNIVGRLEKKLAEQVPTQLPPALVPELFSKITEMEASFKDFQEKLMLGAAQTKNTEESRISGRREIEELLKVVRDQQKYSELDRQMHDQLEKAWARVEEMEKRMMEVYSAAAKKPAEPAVPAVSPGEIAAEVRKAVSDGFEERFAQLEAAVKNAAARIETIPGAASDLAGRAAGLSTVVEGSLTVISSEIRKLHSEYSVEKERLEEVLNKVKKELLSSVEMSASEGSGVLVKHIEASAVDGRERVDMLGKALAGRMDDLAAQVRENTLKITAGSGVLVKHIEASAVEGRERVDMLGKALAGRMDDLAAQGRENTLKIAALEGCVRSENEKIISVVSSMEHALERSLCVHIEEAAVRAASGNALLFEKIKTECGLSAYNVAATVSAVRTISEIEQRLGGVLAGLRTFVKALEPVNLGALLGVSGDIVRGGFESARELVCGLEKEMILLSGEKAKIEASVKRPALIPGGEEK